jgi:hypothetical protein
VACFAIQLVFLNTFVESKMYPINAPITKTKESLLTLSKYVNNHIPITIAPPIKAIKTKSRLFFLYPLLWDTNPFCLWSKESVLGTKSGVLTLWRGMWGLNPRGLSTTDLAGLPHTRLGESRTPCLHTTTTSYLIFKANGHELFQFYATPSFWQIISRLIGCC